MVCQDVHHVRFSKNDQLFPKACQKLISEQNRHSRSCSHIKLCVNLMQAQFKEKMLYSDVQKYFPEYQGSSSDYNAVQKFFRDMFVTLNRSKEKEIYLHYTCVTHFSVLIRSANLIDIAVLSIQKLYVSSWPL